MDGGDDEREHVLPAGDDRALAAGIAQKAFSAADLEQSYEGVRYACAGVSQESRDDPRWTSYPVKLVFAAADGGFLGDVKVKIGDAKGDTVLQAHCLSPWLLVDLAPGSYKVEAMAQQDFSRASRSASAAGISMSTPPASRRSRTSAGIRRA